jgi:hypothetical protein
MSEDKPSKRLTLQAKPGSKKAFTKAEIDDRRFKEEIKRAHRAEIWFVRHPLLEKGVVAREVVTQMQYYGSYTHLVFEYDPFTPASVPIDEKKLRKLKDDPDADYAYPDPVADPRLA